MREAMTKQSLQKICGVCSTQSASLIVFPFRLACGGKYKLADIEIQDISLFKCKMVHDNKNYVGENENATLSNNCTP